MEPTCSKVRGWKCVIAPDRHIISLSISIIKTQPIKKYWAHIQNDNNNVLSIRERERVRYTITISTWHKVLFKHSSCSLPRGISISTNSLIVAKQIKVLTYREKLITFTNLQINFDITIKWQIPTLSLLIFLVLFSICIQSLSISVYLVGLLLSDFAVK